MAQRYGRHPNGRYWHYNTTSDLIELQMTTLPDDVEDWQILDYEESVEYLSNVNGCNDAEGLLNDETIAGIYDPWDYMTDDFDHLCFKDYWFGEEST